MSLLLELEVPDLDWDLLERLTRQTKREGLLAAYGQRRRWWRKHPSSHLLLEDDLGDETSVFDDENVDTDDAAIAPAGRDPLARTLLVLGELLTPGWTFHAGWVGDDERVVALSASELAELARNSELDGEVKYRVVA
jgi:hypothetical protein